MRIERVGSRSRAGVVGVDDELIRYNWQLMQIRKQAPKYFYRRLVHEQGGTG